MINSLLGVDISVDCMISKGQFILILLACFHFNCNYTLGLSRIFYYVVGVHSR